MKNTLLLAYIKKQLCISLFAIYSPVILYAEVITDGSIGLANSISGPDFAITQDLGKTVGQNLFHSFSQFNINQNETASFSGTSSIQNIISRVTGGDPSNINGTIQSTIEGANLYLLNPSGIIFGQGASLDLTGSFHASTADYLNFSNGEQFYVQPLSSEVLSSSSPESFGFLGNKTVFDADISSSGSQLYVLDEKDISLVGHNIKLDQNTDIYAPSGQINIAAVAGKGELPIDLANVSSQHIDTSGFIQIKDGTIIEVSNSSADESSILSGGAVYIKGGNFSLVDNSHIYSINASVNEAKIISIDAADINISEHSGIFSNTSSEGKGGDIKFNASNNVVISQAKSFDGHGVISRTDGLGNSGDINISAKNILVNQNGSIDIATSGDGDAGTINLHAQDSVRLTGSAFISADSQEFTDDEGTIYKGTGNGGTINIHADSFSLQDNSRIDAGAFSSGSGGNINITVNNDATIKANSHIFVDTHTAANGGTLNISAKNLYLDGNRDIINGSVEKNSASSIDSSSKGVKDRFDGVAVYSQQGTGNAGNITINVIDTLSLKGGSSIYTESLWNFEENQGIAGNAGEIKITANNINLTELSYISSESINSGGGAINVSATNELYLLQGIITSSVLESIGNGGNITIDSKNYVILNQGQIIAQAFQGSGGNIFIKTNDYIASTSSIVDASSQLGIDGSVIIESPSIDSDATIQTLSKRYLDTKKWQQKPCASKTLDQSSSFIVAGRKGLATLPDDMMSSDFDDVIENNTKPLNQIALQKNSLNNKQNIQNNSLYSPSHIPFLNSKCYQAL